MGLWPALQNYLMWDQMRMDPTDFADVTGYTYTYLMNGLSPQRNWTGLFRPGERVRLRFITAAGMTFYDVRIPGLTMTVVQADGQNMQPVVVDELRMGVAETYDVIVEPVEDRAYTIFAETMDRSGYARGTLAPRPGMSAEIPERRPRPLRTMEDMGMQHGGHGHGRHEEPHGSMTMPGMEPSGDMPDKKPSDENPHKEHMQHGQGMPPMQGMHEILGMKETIQAIQRFPAPSPSSMDPAIMVPATKLWPSIRINIWGNQGEDWKTVSGGCCATRI